GVSSRHPGRVEALAVRRTPRALGQGRSAAQPARAPRRRRPSLRGRPRLRGDGHAADRQRAPLAPQLHPARPPRSGEEPHPARARRPPRPRDPGRRRQRGQRRPVRADLQVRTPAAGGGRRGHADRVGRPRGPLRREAGDARRDDRRHHRRRRPDQGGARRTPAVRRADHPLRHAAARQPRHLRPQRAARPRRQGAGRPVQHHAGRRRPDQRLSGAPAAGRDALLHRQSRGLHGARQDHHAAQGPHRLRDRDALSRDRRPRHGDHAAGGLDGARRRRGERAARARPTAGVRGGRARRVRGAHRQAHRQAVGRLAAHADHGHGERGLQRGAPRRARRRPRGRAAPGRRLRGAAGDHREARAGVRGRAGGRTGDRARADPPRRRRDTQGPRGHGAHRRRRHLVRRGR
ncbi:MAG: Magnesium chelatase, subunit ChlI, partial [uncultured Solirubrobacteraceae bacterium]